MPENNKMTFEDVLARDGQLIYTNVGDSMMPMIRQGRDLLVIIPPGGRLKKYDIPLYKRNSGQYVLHRILKVREKDYVIRGDNCISKETGITDRHIIGVLTAVVRDGRKIPLDTWRYRLYVHLWCGLFPVRAMIMKAKQLSAPALHRFSKNDGKKQFNRAPVCYNKAENQGSCDKEQGDSNGKG